jgi:hypothetical protein
MKMIRSLPSGFCALGTGRSAASVRVEFRIANWTLIGPESFNIRRGKLVFWDYDIGVRAVERVDGKYGRLIIKSFDKRGVLRTATTRVHFIVASSPCGDC